MPRTHAYSAANSVKFATLKRIVAKNVIKGSTLMKANACNVKVDAENVKIDKHALNAFQKRVSNLMEQYANAVKEHICKMINALSVLMVAKAVKALKSAPNANRNSS